MEKLKNFFYYEWKKMLAVIFVVGLTLLTVKQCNDKVATDLGVLYISGVRSENLPLLKEELEKAAIATDIDSDGKTIVKVREIPIPKSEEIKLEQQVPQQIQFEIISGENLLYITDLQTARNNAVEMSFADITAVSKKYSVPDDKCLKYSDGKVFAVSLEGNKFLEELGIRTKGMYISQRNYIEKEKNNPKNVNARRAMEYILERAQ